MSDSLQVKEEFLIGDSKDWIRLNRAHVWHGIPGKDHFVSLDTNPNLSYGRNAYLRFDISYWIIENNIKIESRIGLFEHDTILSDFLSIRFVDPRDKIYFIMRFEE